MNGEPLEVVLFLPQMRMTIDAIVERAVAAEEAGFTGIAFMDHLAPPMADDQPMYEAMTLAAWVAAHTQQLKVATWSCATPSATRRSWPARRSPSTMRRAAASNWASGGARCPRSCHRFGVTSAPAGERVERLGETLDVLRGAVDRRAGRPTPAARPAGRGGPAAHAPRLHPDRHRGRRAHGRSPSSRRHADWWNLPVHLIGRLDELRDQAGSARASIQQVICFVVDEERRAEVESTAERRFGAMGPMLKGDPDHLRAELAAIHQRGVERVYLWFSDFAEPATLQAFGAAGARSPALSRHWVGTGAPRIRVRPVAVGAGRSHGLPDRHRRRRHVHRLRAAAARTDRFVLEKAPTTPADQSRRRARRHRAAGQRRGARRVAELAGADHARSCTARPPATTR